MAARVWFLVLWRARSDFVFVDFNTTHGLRFNGDASTTACSERESRSYGAHERYDADGALPVLRGEDDEGEYEIATVTHARDAASDADLRATSQIAGHREDYARADASCAGRVRLTPSRAGARGSVWHHLAAPVAGGFETLFTFKVSDHSRHCTRHRDLDFSLEFYESCSVHGGDGLAFVVQADPNGTAALGEGGGELGYGGIRNSIAVEFDTDYNPNPDAPEAGDAAPLDHVELRSRGARANSAFGADAALAPLVVHDLADGAEHLVKVAYRPTLDMRYFQNLSVTANAAQYMVDGGENRRVGLLLVWLDEGVAADSPSIAVPVNLGEMLQLDGEGAAFLGFTAATGRRWEKHDLLSWYVCDRADCANSEPSAEKSLFDFNTKSRASGKYTTLQHNPGEGFGGTVQDLDQTTTNPRAPTSHTSADNAPYKGAGTSHFAKDRNQAPPPGWQHQAPPNTEF